MDTKGKIAGVVFNIDENHYNTLVKQGIDKNKAARQAALNAIIFREDSTKHEIIDFGSYSPNAKETKIKEIYLQASRDGAKEEISSYLNSDPIQSAIMTDCLRRAANHEEYLPENERNETIKKVVKKNTGKKVAVGVLTAGIITSLAACSIKKLQEEPEIDTTSLENVEEEAQGYGFYKFDLSSMEDMSEYKDNAEILSESEVEAKYGIKGVSQKDRSLLRLDILERFNNEVTLVDEETKQLGGLTIEQLIALDAYANSNIYEKEDYIKNFGLYNFRSITDDFQQATLNASAYLAIPSVDGSALADIFKDEKVKENYLKQLDYRDKILNAENKTEQKKIVKEYVEFLTNCSINQASDEYLDYDQHPGMAFVTSAMILALNYHNIELDKDVVSKVIIIGTDENQSKINSICADAQTKLDSAAELAESLEIYLPMNYNTTIDNEKEIALAAKEEREPQLKLLYYPELDTVIREILCDQGQINELTNKTLEKEGKLVTLDNQEKIKSNAVNIQVELVKSGKGGYYKDAHTANLAVKLQKPGDKVVETQKGVTFTTEEEIKKLEEKAPEQVQEAKDNYNNEHGTLDNSTPAQQEKVEEIIQNDIKNTEQEGKNYYNDVVSYYQTHGSSTGIPSELQEAYNNLGADTFNLAMQTGNAKYMTNDENKYSGGEIVIDSEFKDAEIYQQPQAPVESVDHTTQAIENNSNLIVPPENNNTQNQESNNNNNEAISVPPTNNIDNSQNNNASQDFTYLPGMEGVEYEGEIIIGNEANAVSTMSLEKTAKEAPAEIAPVVETSNNITTDNSALPLDVESIIENMTDEEWEALIANVERVEDENSDQFVKTK